MPKPIRREPGRRSHEMGPCLPAQKRGQLGTTPLRRPTNSWARAGGLRASAPHYRPPGCVWRWLLQPNRSGKLSRGTRRAGKLRQPPRQGPPVGPRGNLSRFKGPKEDRDSPWPANWMRKATLAEQIAASQSGTPTTVPASTLAEASHQERDLT
jgi:hypothetical protein